MQLYQNLISIKSMKICPNEGKGREKARAKGSPSPSKVASKVKSITKKRKWSTEDDQLLLQLVYLYGIKKWNIISNSFENRNGK